MESVFNFNELKNVLDNSEGFMIGVTTINKGELRHYLMTEKFPMVDMLKSVQKVKELIVNRLEGDDVKDTK